MSQLDVTLQLKTLARRYSDALRHALILRVKHEDGIKDRAGLL